MPRGFSLYSVRKATTFSSASAARTAVGADDTAPARKVRNGSATIGLGTLASMFGFLVPERERYPDEIVCATAGVCPVTFEAQKEESSSAMPETERGSRVYS